MHSSDPSPLPPCFKRGGGVNFGYLSRRGDCEKFKEVGGSLVQGQVFLKRGLALFRFNFFRVYHFYIWKLLFLLQNCVMHLKKKYIFLPP